MSNNNKNQSKNYNKKIIIVIEIAMLLTVVVTLFAVLQGDVIESFQEPTKYTLRSTQAPETEQSLFGVGTDGATASDDGDYVEQEPSTIASHSPSQSVQVEDVSKWSKADIVNKAKQAVNKTKGNTGSFSVHHKESFEASVTECSGGTLVQSVVNLMVGWVVKPVDETLYYSNARAENSDGETVAPILPLESSFNLSPSGVSSANVKLLNNEYVITLELISESVGINDVPVHNAGSIGYLNVADFDISFMEIDYADITYSGSTIELHVNQQGYVTYAVYNVPLAIDGAAHKGSISGSATIVGKQSEIWTFNY